MRRYFLWLILLDLFLAHPVLAQDKQQPLLTIPHQWSVSGLRWHSNGRDFWTWGRDFLTLGDGTSDYQDHLQLWNGTTGNLENQLLYHGDNVTMYLDWSAGENRVLVYSGTSLEIWDALRGEKMWTLNNDTGRISGAHWNADFSRILYWSYDDGSIHIWDTSAGKEIFLAETNLPSDLLDVQWSPDEKTILGVLTQSPGHVELWDIATGQKQQTFEYAGMVYQASFNADGSRILMIGDKIIQLVDTVTGNILNARTDDMFLYHAEWSPNRQLIAVRSENKPVIQIWVSASGNPISSIVQSENLDDIIYEVQWSKDNQRILTHSPDGIDIWDAIHGPDLLQIPIEARAYNMSWLSWSRDETKLVIMLSNSSLQVVTISDHTAVELELPAPITLSLPAPTFTWNSDQSQVMLSGVDNITRVWDTASGKLLATLQHPIHEGFQSAWVNQAVWSPDEKFILTSAMPDYCTPDGCPSEAMVWQAP